MSYLRSFFGGVGATNQDDGEVVEKFVERLETASTVQDRKSALKGLRACAKAARLAVATMGMNLYMEVLNSEDDVEVVALTLDILNAVLADENGPLEDDELGDRLSEVIVKKAVFMPAILKWLDNEHFTIRKNAVQLLTTLLRHRAGEVQDAIIRDPTGTSRVVELLHEQREIIRNHVVLMLSELSRGNLQLQQLLVFQNCFQLLFTIIEQEPTDSIVIEDCLFVMLNLLKRNANNQQLFRENSLINRLHQLTGDFLYPREDADITLESDWLPQKTANFIFILQVIRALVSPVDNAHANTHASQRCLLQTGLIDLLCRTFLSEVEVSTDVLTETAATLADVIRGNYANQNHFAASTVATPEGTKSALLLLLITMTTEKQLFRLRSAVFYCFLCYLYGNDTGKQRVIDSLLPDDNERPVENGQIRKRQQQTENLGQYLCASIISAESVQVWFGAVCLMHTLFDADHLKPQLLRVQLETMPNEEPSTLLAHIGDLLISLGARRLQTRCALLMLLSVWLHNCGQAVEEFVSKDAHIDYLTSHLVETNTELREGEDQVIKGLIAFLLGICVQHYENQESDRRSKLIDVVNRRVGMEAVAECLEGVTKSEFYIRAAQKPMSTVGNPQDLLLEYQFCKLFKSLEGPLTKIFRPNGDFVASATNSDVVVASYKKLIKQQDEHIAELKQQVDQLKATAEKTAAGTGTPPTDEPNGTTNAPKHAEFQLLRAENEDLKRQLAEARQHCVAYAGLWSQHEQLTQVLQQWQAEAERRKVWGEQWQSYQLAQLPDPTAAAVHQLQSQLAEIDQRLQYGWQQFEAQSKTQSEVITALERQKLENQQLSTELADVKQQLATSSHKELNSTKNELESIRREHDDTLLLLAEQDAKITGYRQRLRAHGEAVTDDEGEAEETTAPEHEQPNNIV